MKIYIVAWNFTDLAMRKNLNEHKEEPEAGLGGQEYLPEQKEEKPQRHRHVQRERSKDIPEDFGRK